jgi:alkylation response protein AidB-like acyl-CoA dehydrogenase
MDMDLTEEQQLLRGSAREFLEKQCTSDAVREIETTEIGFSREMWQQMANLGWLGLPLPSEYGGAGMGTVDLAILSKELGRVLCPSPYLTAVVLTGGTITALGTEEQKKAYLPRIASGDAIISFAFQEESGELDPAGVETRIEVVDGSRYLNGTKLFVEFANSAERLVVAATDASGLSLSLADPSADGLRITRTPTMARDAQFRVDLSGARVSNDDMVGPPDQAWPALETVIHRGALAFAAYALGAAERMHEMTAEYARNRVQFGRPIGSFQLIQNYLAQLIIEIWGAETLVYYTAWALDSGVPARELVAKTKAFVGDVAKRTTDIGSQIFGGIGYIEGVDSTLYLRRGKQYQLLMGDTSYWEDIVADEMLKV